MALSDIFRSERSTWTVPGPPDLVYAWFVYEGAGGRQQWCNRRLRLAGDRWAGTGPGSGGGVVLRPGPWLEVVASPLTPGGSTTAVTRVDCTIGPQAACWGWAAILGVLLTFATVVWTAVLVTGIDQLAHPAVMVAAIGPLALGVLELRRRSRSGRELRSWAEEVRDRAIRALTGDPRVSSAAPLAPAGPATGNDVRLAAADRNAWHRSPETLEVGHGLTTRRRAYFLSQPVVVTRRLLVAAPPGWVSERGGELFLDPGIPDRAAARGQKPIRSGLNSCRLLVTPDGTGSRIEVVTSPTTGLVSLVTSALILAGIAGVGGIGRGIGPPETPWIFGGLIVVATVTQLVGSWRAAERLHHVARETMTAVGAQPLDGPHSDSSSGRPPGSPRRTSPYTSGPDTWRDG